MPLVNNSSGNISRSNTRSPPQQRQGQEHFELNDHDVDLGSCWLHDEEDGGQRKDAYSSNSDSEFTAETDSDGDVSTGVSALGATLSSLALHSDGNSNSSSGDRRPQDKEGWEDEEEVGTPPRGRGRSIPQALASARHLSDVVLSHGLTMQLAPLALVSRRTADREECHEVGWWSSKLSTATLRCRSTVWKSMDCLILWVC